MVAAGSPPGPRGHFLLGSRPEFRRDMLAFFAHCAHNYGPITAFSLGPVRCCFISDPALIKQVLVDEADHVIKHGNARQLKLLLGNGLLLNEGESWRAQRRLIQPAFHHERIHRYGETMVQHTQGMLETWQDGSVRDLHADMMRLTLEIVAKTLFGLDLSPHADLVARMAARFMDQFEAMLTARFPLPLTFPTPRNIEARRLIRQLNRVVQKAIHDVRLRGNKTDTLLDWLVTAQARMEMDERQLRDEIVTLLLAGHETTANALAYALFLLAQHPETEARLMAELDTVLAGRAPKADDLPQLPYTRWVLQEAMRLYPPVWSLGREALAEIELGGYRIAPGTQILMAQSTTHRDPVLFPDPDSFLPERWAPENANSLPKYAYFPFGGGPRFCLGSTFAMTEATLILSTILQGFHLEPAPAGRLTLQPSVSLRPRHGVHGVVHWRLNGVTGLT